MTVNKKISLDNKSEALILKKIKDLMPLLTDSEKEKILAFSEGMLFFKTKELEFKKAQNKEGDSN